MTLSAESVDSFLEQFEASAPQIRDFPGCYHLELWRDADTPTVYTTYSHWDNRAALDRYRNSTLFTSTWASVKPLFSAPPEAHSYSVARSADAIEEATAQ
jgi:quinol monooxygenase YgiN